MLNTRGVVDRRDAMTRIVTVCARLRAFANSRTLIGISAALR